MEDFNPASFTVIELIYPVVLAAIGAICLALVSATFLRGDVSFILEFRKVFSYYCLAGIPVALIGYSVGFLTGISRSPAVGSVIPAVLAVIGGLSVYAFGTDNKYKAVVAYSVSLLVVSLFYGTQSGSFEREWRREDRLKSIFELESRLRHYRTNRDLPEKISDWLFLGEAGGK
jgi:hypothetical protein